MTEWESFIFAFALTSASGIGFYLWGRRHGYRRAQEMIRHYSPGTARAIFGDRK